MDNIVRTTELQENPDRGHFYHFKCLSNKSTYSSCPTISYSSAVNFCFGNDRELCKKNPISF